MVFHKPPAPKPAPRQRDPGGFVELTCPICQTTYQKRIAHISYRQKQGANNFFCSRACAYESRRDHKPVEQQKAEKAAYDNRYRKRDYVKVKRAESHKRTYDPERQRAYNQSRMAHHVEYCRRSEYRAKKKDYDQQYRAKKNYGEYWESALLIQQIEAQYDQREVRQINNLQNKTQKRKRAWKKLKNPNSPLAT